jgi:hypothetical protein
MFTERRSVRFPFIGPENRVPFTEPGEIRRTSVIQFCILPNGRASSAQHQGNAQFQLPLYHVVCCAFPKKTLPFFLRAQRVQKHQHEQTDLGGIQPVSTSPRKQGSPQNGLAGSRYAHRSV